jgi:hypothetical protein
MNLMSVQNFFSQQIIIFFHKDIDDDDYEYECHEITEYLKKILEVNMLNK